MELYLQFGYGMMGLSEHLISDWQSGVVILSPRDLEYSQIEKVSLAINNNNGKVAIDPQFYIPRGDHERLTSHSFWPDNYQTAFFDNNAIRTMLNILLDEYNGKFGSLLFILPGIYTSEVNEDWDNYNSLIISEARNLKIEQELFSTLSFSNEVMQSEEQIHLALEYTENWDVEGYYLVPEPPNHSYLIDDPIWLINLLDLASGLKQQGKKVIVGYSNHQLLCLALAKVDAICSGNWLNVRSFNTERFHAPTDGISRRSKWYYCPQALSEYQIPFLDIAHRMGLTQELATASSFHSPYADILFSGAQPSSTGYNEPASFKHYLQCLRIQTQNAVKPTYESTKQGLILQLETASSLTEFLNSNGIRGRDRDFSQVVDVNLSAVAAFDRLRGMIVKHHWDDL
ncbi:MAG: hypothetical protein KDI01_11920 [Halioglobus sp.]|nr:hypothetical protein [Halioglobus sp.]